MKELYSLEPPKDLQKEADKIKQIIANRTQKMKSQFVITMKIHFTLLKNIVKHGLLFHDKEMKATS